MEAGQFLSLARVITDTRIHTRTGIAIKLTVSSCTGKAQHEAKSTTLSLMKLRLRSIELCCRMQ